MKYFDWCRLRGVVALLGSCYKYFWWTSMTCFLFLYIGIMMYCYKVHADLTAIFTYLHRSMVNTGFFPFACCHLHITLLLQISYKFFSLCRPLKRCIPGDKKWHVFIVPKNLSFLINFVTNLYITIFLIDFLLPEQALSYFHCTRKLAY